MEPCLGQQERALFGDTRREVCTKAALLRDHKGGMDGVECGSETLCGQWSLGRGVGRIAERGVSSCGVGAAVTGTGEGPPALACLWHPLSFLSIWMMFF